MWQRRMELNLLFCVAQAFRHIHPAMKEWEVPQVPEWGEANKPKALDFLEYPRLRSWQPRICRRRRLFDCRHHRAGGARFHEAGAHRIPEELSNVRALAPGGRRPSERGRVSSGCRPRPPGAAKSGPAASASKARSAARCRMSRARCCLPSSSARVLIAEPGAGHEGAPVSGMPFTDASGDRLRDWLGVSQRGVLRPSGISPSCRWASASRGRTPAAAICRRAANARRPGAPG